MALLPGVMLIVVLGPSGTSPTTTTTVVTTNTAPGPAAGPPRPHLFDLAGRLRFGPGSDALGAHLVYDRTGHVVGRYVDDLTPNQGAVIDAEWARGVPLIVAGIPPGTPSLRYAHALNAQEWYPYNSGHPVSSWGRMPRSRAYILQWRFSFQGPPPTRRQRAALLRQARRSHPILILGY